MRLIDLTLPLTDGMAVYPGDPPVRLRQVRGMASHGFRLHEISLGGHAGTHVNAPWHMAENGKRLEELPLSRFVARAVVRVTGPVQAGRSIRPVGDPALAARGGAPMPLPERRAEGRGDAGWRGPIPAGLGLIFADAPLDAGELPHVLAAKPPFVAQAVEFPLDEDVERELCRAGIVSFENLANTGELPRGEAFLFIGLPLAVPGDGAPVRAVAILGAGEKEGE